MNSDIRAEWVFVYGTCAPAARMSFGIDIAGCAEALDSPLRMKTHGSATTFQVSELDASLKFYTATLGFSERFRFGDYAGVEHGGVQVHLSGPGASNKRQVGQGSIYIFCDDCDSYYQEIVAKGARPQALPRDYEYGMRDFALEDPDGNLLAFGQESRRDD